MDNSEQWASGGDCRLCWKSKHYSKPCKKSTRRRTGTMMGAMMSAFLKKMMLPNDRKEDED